MGGVPGPVVGGLGRLPGNKRGEVAKMEQGRGRASSLGCRSLWLKRKKRTKTWSGRAVANGSQRTKGLGLGRKKRKKKKKKSFGEQPDKAMPEWAWGERKNKNLGRNFLKHRRPTISSLKWKGSDLKKGQGKAIRLAFSDRARSQGKGRKRCGSAGLEKEVAKQNPRRVVAIRHQPGD